MCRTEISPTFLCISIIHYFFLLSSILFKLLCEYTTIFQSIISLMGMWTVSSLKLLWKGLLQKCLYNSFVNMFSFFLGKFLGVEFPGHIMHVFWKILQRLFKSHPHFTFLPATYGSSSCYTFLPAFGVAGLRQRLSQKFWFVSPWGPHIAPPHPGSCSLINCFQVFEHAMLLPIPSPSS